MLIIRNAKMSLSIVSSIFIFFVGIATPITKDRIQEDEVHINAFLKETEDDVCKASEAKHFPYIKGNVGELKPSDGRKSIAKSFHGISSKAYDAIPFEFFNHPTDVRTAKASISTEEAVQYMNTGKEQFTQYYLNHMSKKFDLSQFAEFSFDYLVDHLRAIPAQEKETIKKNPLKINEYIKHEPLRSQYMSLTMQNIVIRYYLEKDLGMRK